MKTQSLTSRLGFNELQLLVFLFLFICAAYFLSAKGYPQSGDTRFSIATAYSLVEESSMAIHIRDRTGGWFLNEQSDRAYSKYGIGLAYLFVPVVLAAKFASGVLLLPEKAVFEFLLSLFNIPFGAGSCILLYLLARRFGAAPRTAWETSLIFAFFTLCWRYSVWDFSEVTRMFLLLGGFYLVTNPMRKVHHAALAGLLCGYSVTIKFTAGVYCPAIALFLLLSSRDWKRNVIHTAVFCSIVAAFGLFVLWLNYYRWGSFFNFGYDMERDCFHFEFWRAVRNAVSLLVGADKGILVYSPPLILGLIGYWSFYRHYPKEALLALSFVVINLVLISMFHFWFSAWAWGARYLVEAHPFYFLPASVVLAVPRRTTRFIIGLLLTISFLIQIVSIVQNQHEYHHIQRKRVLKEYRSGMPNDIIGVATILLYRLDGNPPVYPVSLFGIDESDYPGENSIDTSNYGRSVHLWYRLLAERYDCPQLVWYAVPFFFLLPLLWICMVSMLKRL